MTFIDACTGLGTSQGPSTALASIVSPLWIQDDLKISWACVLLYSHPSRFSEWQGIMSPNLPGSSAYSFLARIESLARSRTAGRQGLAYRDQSHISPELGSTSSLHVVNVRGKSEFPLGRRGRHFAEQAMKFATYTKFFRNFGNIS